MGRLLSQRRGDRVGEAVGRRYRLLEAAKVTLGPRNFWRVVVTARRTRRGVQAYQLFCGYAILLADVLRLLCAVLTILGDVRETKLWGKKKKW